MEGSFFTAYKVTGGGVVTFQETKRAILSNLILIDNSIGAVANIGQEGDELWAHIKDSVFYGESPAPDCEAQNQCLTGGQNGQLCGERSAIIISYFSQIGKGKLVTN